MKFNNVFSMSLVAGLLAALAACTDESDSNRSRYTTGAITAFGSVYVNSAEYNTDNATVYVEDQVASQSNLRVGMMVTIKESSPGIADTIYYADDVEGIVLSSNILADGTGTLDVMGQTVTVDAMTVFESYVSGITSAAGIEVGNIVEVTGSSSGNGSILATRLELKAVNLADYLASHPEGIEVKGTVRDHSDASKTFALGSLVVDYTNAVLDDMPSGIWDGLFVEVKSKQALDSSGHMLAYKVELENGGSKGYHDHSSEVEVKGKVSEVTDDSVTVNGVTFLLDENTEYEDGSADRLLVGAFIEVEGYPNSNGDLVAKEVEFEDHDNHLEIQGYVAAIATTDTPNVGTIEINGQTFQIDSSTIMQDSSDAHLTHFNLLSVGVGDLIKVYYFDDNGTLRVTKLERQSVAM